ncbi:nucleoid-associated protein [Algoriphagus taiwanensis]|uniref:Nucleoid-associated protein n=1 Tax=Algoriphagus taiwanensis TaxID=1445656 RepID=A0ABQ6PWL5_9BACT|nr:nucleoid-associated protein [Algoriphagus taiwanensis]
MTTLDFTQAGLQNLITHHVGNKLRDENIKLTDEPSAYSDETKDFLLRYFLLPIKSEEFYEFTHTIKLEMNDVYSIVKNVFNETKEFITHSKDLAKLLYENSMHPKIKGGELNIAYFTNVVLDDEIVDAIGIYKSETDVPFLKMKIGKSNYSINHEFGFEIKGVDKGCIIFNTNQGTGFKVLVIDNSNKSVEAQYWKDDFLKLKPIANEFHQTNQFLGITKKFVTKQLDEEFEVSKADKIDLLNRSVEYFKTHETFDKKEFEEEVFQDSGIINSFRNFDSTYRQENEIEITDSFDISPQAVKKQTRVFKSVLKLDKNFHIYIHGNRDMIEQGIDQDGRKYYKIYYDKEN